MVPAADEFKVELDFLVDIAFGWSLTAPLAALSALLLPFIFKTLADFSVRRLVALDLDLLRSVLRKEGMASQTSSWYMPCARTGVASQKV